MRDVDQIIKSIISRYPEVSAEQIKVVHRGFDDGIWYFDQPESEFQVQIESSTGMCPFVIETDESEARYTGKSIEEVVRIVCQLLHLDDQIE